MSKCEILILIIPAFFLGSNAIAYDEKYAHPYITESAINKSELDNYLKSYLNLPGGIGTRYDGEPILKLITNGSANEDLGVRARNHFWNPCKDNGLNDLMTGLPNRSWALGYGENGEELYACGWGIHWMDGSCNDYSWRKAREHFYEALTDINEEVRNENFREMCESLGRIIHLIEDMGVPAHTRNDFSGHLDYTELAGPDPMSWLGNLYEFHVKKRARENAAYIPGLAQGAPIPEFSTPQEYWDAGVYNGTNPEATVAGGGRPQAGLAEYCNANYLSRFTIFTDGLPQGHKHYHPFPGVSSLNSPIAVPHEITAEDGKVDLVMHSAKDKHGEQIDNFVAVKYMADRIYANSENDLTVYYRLAYCLDDAVHEAYAANLVPKTVGYAAGLINYFFRGTMSIGDSTIETFDDRYRISFFVTNTTATGEDMNDGRIELVIKYPTGENTYGYVRALEANGKREVPGSLSFDVLRKNLPNRQLDGLLDLFVVYRGNLGAGSAVHETDAVCVGHKQIQFFSSTSHEMVDIALPTWYLGNSGSVCANNLFPGCKYRLNIEDVVYSGPGDMSICFAQNDCTATRECDGDTIGDLRSFHQQDSCVTVGCGEWSRGIGVLLNVQVDKDPEARFQPGDFYEVEIVLTNLTTGAVHRCRKRCEYEGTCQVILQE